MDSIVQLPKNKNEEVIVNSQYRKSLQLIKDSSRQRINQSVLVTSHKDDIVPKVKFINMKTPQLSKLSSSRLKIRESVNNSQSLSISNKPDYRTETKEKQKVKSLIQQCFSLEKSNPLPTFEK